MNKQSANRREDDDGLAIAMDRLSQLPQPILHSILSLLPQKDAVQTSVLSKSWRYLWHGRFNFEFCNFWFARKKESRSFVDKTLQRYLDQNLSLQKFLVDVSSYEVDLAAFVLLQKWIPMVIMNMDVSSLSLIFSWGTKAYPLPLVVFQSESLVELHLTRCDFSTLKSTDNVMLKNLQTLRLHYVYITDEIFEKIISGCPLIETLNLSQCIGLKSIKLHKHHIVKNFRCFICEQTIIEIEDPHTLESLYIENWCPDWFFPFKNMDFLHLKSLKLFRVKLPAETFDNFSSFFPCLSELILKSCDGLKEFRLLSSSIKRLTIWSCLRHSIKAFIDTPNIVYFEFSGAHCFLPLIKFTTPSNEWKSQISLHYMLKHSEKDDTSWLLKLNRLLKSLSQSHITLSLHGIMYKKLHINDSYAGFCKPIVVEHFKLYEFLSHPDLLDPTIFNCFFWIFRPRYIHMDCYAAKKLSEFICNLIPEKKRCYFWLQDWEELIIEVWDMKAEEWNCVQRTSLQALPDKQTIRFRLTWREQLSKLTYLSSKIYFSIYFMIELFRKLFG
ncbi:hypothetical protein CASFOL_021902 [Castilleja foliolosa]|uniref:F-box domain-containing protein n=1 Tax=Castilleja foliolosa TaxID=1961234 RepID=A0ABD3CYS1_9LAMI